MSRIIEQHNISLPKFVRKTKSGGNTEDHDERFHALKANCLKSHDFLFDS